MKVEMILRNDLCPCHSKSPYETCCGPYHQGTLAPNPITLMRSRYAAYALELPEYIIKTTHPQNPKYTADSAKWKKEICDFYANTSFEGLQILDAEFTEKEGYVTFKAILKQENRDASFTEKSYFEKINNAWLYHSGQYQHV